jgi:flagellar protein FlaG
MVQEIHSKVPQPAVMRPEMLAPSPKAVESVREPESTHPSAAVTPPAKPVVNFDPEKERKELEEAILKLNEMLQDNSRTVSFSMDVKLGQPIVFVKNLSTGEVVRQIPNEVVVRMAHAIEDFKGMLHNKSA